MDTAGAILWAKLKHADEGDKWLSDVVGDRLKKFSFIEREIGLDEAVFTLRNDDLAMLDSTDFLAGQVIEMQWGWPGDTTMPRNMIVKKNRGTDPREVVCYSEEVLMDLEDIKQDWGRTTDFNIVQQIASRNKNADGQAYNGVFVSIDGSSHMKIIRHNGVRQKTSDARMLAKLATRHYYLMWIDHLGLHFGPRNMDAPPRHTYQYGTDPGVGYVLSRPEIKENFANDATIVEVHARDPQNRKAWVTAAFGVSKADFTSLGEFDIVGDPYNTTGQRQPRLNRKVVRNAGLMTQEEVEMEAERRYRMISQERYNMEFTALGVPAVHARDIIEMKGLGQTYSGLWYVREVETVLGDGVYKQHLKCIRDSVGRTQAAKARKITRGKNDQKGDDASGKKNKDLFPYTIIKWTARGWRPFIGYHEDKEGNTLVRVGSEVRDTNVQAFCDRLNGMSKADASKEARRFNSSRG